MNTFSIEIRHFPESSGRDPENCHFAQKSYRKVRDFVFYFKCTILRERMRVRVYLTTDEHRDNFPFWPVILFIFVLLRLWERKVTSAFSTIGIKRDDVVGLLLDYSNCSWDFVSLTWILFVWVYYDFRFVNYTNKETWMLCSARKRQKNVS